MRTDLMNEVLYIKWPNGSAQFEVYYCFPMTKARFKKFVSKLLAKDDNRAELRDYLTLTFTEMIMDNYDEARAQAKIYSDYRTHAAEEEAFAKRPFHVNGRRVTDKEFKEMMEKVKHYRAVSREAMEKGEKLLKKNQKLNDHIEYLRELEW